MEAARAAYVGVAVGAAVRSLAVYVHCQHLASGTTCQGSGFPQWLDVEVCVYIIPGPPFHWRVSIIERGCGILSLPLVLSVFALSILKLCYFTHNAFEIVMSSWKMYPFIVYEISLFSPVVSLYWNLLSCVTIVIPAFICILFARCTFFLSILLLIWWE